MKIPHKLSVMTRGIARRSASRRAGSPSFALRSSRVPVVASHHWRDVVEEIPIDKTKRHAGVAGNGLTVDGDTALTAALEPLHLSAMHMRMRVARLHDVVEHRPPAQLRKLLEVIEIVHRLGPDQRHLDEAFVALARALSRIPVRSRRAIRSVTIGVPS